MRWHAAVALVSGFLLGCGSGTEQPSMAGGTAAPDSAGVLRVPPDSDIPEGALGASIRRGRALFAATPDSLPEYVGNDLRCTSCHLDDGTRANSAPWVGVYSRFPQFRSRNAKINLIEDRINNCIRRSLNGKPLPHDGPDLADMVAYMSFLSRGVAPPGGVPGRGFVRMTPLDGDSARGRTLFVEHCVRCHGANGEGMDNPDPTLEPRYYPPLWGPRSFNIGAGMSRLRTAASFIRYNMPFDQPGTLSDQESFDLARYMTLQPRPDFRAKEFDWPRGDAPPDVAYPTRARPEVGPTAALLPPSGPGRGLGR